MSGAAVTVEVARYFADLDARKIDAHGNLRVDSGSGYSIHYGRPVSVPDAQRAFQAGDGTVTALYPNGTITVGYSGAKPARVSDAELLRIARGVRPASTLTDASTWFDGRTVVR